MEQAEKYAEEGLELAKTYTDIYYIHGSYDFVARVLREKGEFNKALQYFKTSLEYKQQSQSADVVFRGHMRIFDLYYTQFKSTGDKKYFLEAETIYHKLKELLESHQGEEILEDYVSYIHALLLKTGNISKKAEAIKLLSNHCNLYPQQIDAILELLELLFEDYYLAEDEDTMNQIDALMRQIETISLRNNPHAIRVFVSQQIIIAKYQFYIKGDPGKALDLLQNSRQLLQSYDLNRMSKILENEIVVLESEYRKWNNVSRSVKERIKQSDFNKYIEQALELTKQAR